MILYRIPIRRKKSYCSWANTRESRRTRSRTGSSIKDKRISKRI